MHEATAADLSAIQDLLSERDGVAHEAHSVARLFAGLDPDQCRAWLAEVDGRPAGLTAMLIRRVQDAHQEEPKRVAYWTNLFVRSEFGRLMVYPVLVHTMLKAVKADGLAWCCTVMRRPKVLEGHLKLGFVRLGEIPVLARPLRPVRLLARRFPKWQLAARLGAPLDAAARVVGLGIARTLAGGFDIRDEPWPEVSDDTFAWLAAAGQSSALRVSTLWTPATLRARGAMTLESSPMRLLVARAKGATLGALAYRISEREGIVVAVGMKLWATAGRAAVALIHTFAEQGLRAGADVALWLDGDSEQRGLFRRAGFLPTPERYTLILWPKTAAGEAQPSHREASWRFTFLDHDAF